MFKKLIGFKRVKHPNSYNSGFESSAIQCLPDLILLKIFVELRLDDLLTVNQVCRRWYDLSSFPWCDVKSIDIGQISPSKLIPIIRKCPNITSLHGDHIRFTVKCLRKALQELGPALQSLKIYAGHLRGLSISSAYDYPFEAFQQNLLADCQSLEELVWHSVFMLPCWGRVAAPVCKCLKRLQITGYQDVGQRSWPQLNLSLFDDSRETLEALLINDVTYFLSPHSSSWLNGRCLQKLVHLRGLGLFSTYQVHGYAPPLNSSRLANAVSQHLPNLEILIVSEFSFYVSELVSMLMRSNPLKLLVFAGIKPNMSTFESTHPELLSTNSLQLIGRRGATTHVFYSEPIPEAIRTRLSVPSVFLTRMNSPIAEFFAAAPNCEIFRCSWVARQIAESCRHGADFWNYRKHQPRDIESSTRCSTATLKRVPSHSSYKEISTTGDNARPFEIKSSPLYIIRGLVFPLMAAIVAWINIGSMRRKQSSINDLPYLQIQEIH